MDDGLPNVGAFAAAFDDFQRAMSAAARRDQSALAERIRAYLGVDPQVLPSTVAEFAATDHPNLQLALDAVLAGADVVGYTVRQGGHVNVGLSEVLSGQSTTGPVSPGPVQCSDVEVGDGRVVRCISNGLFLDRIGDAPVALVVAAGAANPFTGNVVRLEGISTDEGAVSQLVRELRDTMRELNVYRGQVISLHLRQDRSIAVRFHDVTLVGRDELILREDTLERLERHTLGMAKEAKRLSAARRDLKRGVLLHGPPGTGKTLSVNYLLGAMRGRTTVVLTGRSLGLVEPALVMARELAPATVVLEDVDLVAAERTLPIGQHSILFDLLNQMEGLAEDADLLFLLTTNRPDVIEPALAARPGRIDLALELPLPDAVARHRLLQLYAHGIELDEDHERAIVARTEGVSGAFIKELMREASLRAALDDRHQADARDVDAALDELLDDRSALTRRLLGQPADGAPTGTHPEPPLESMLRAYHAAGLPMPPELDKR